jgi:ABC-type transport system involved in multi-copper enzyme maturation permease subunit
MRVPIGSAGLGSAARILSVAKADAQILSRARGWGIERTLFSGLLLLVVAVAWPKDWSGSLARMSRFGAEIFQGFFTTAYIATGLLVPALFGGAFAPERRGGNALLLFTTPLKPFEIVLGRFASHTARFLVILACGAPILFSTLFFGGVSGAQILRAVAAILTLGFFAGALTFFFSAATGRSHVAGLLAILVMIVEAIAVAIVAASAWAILRNSWIQSEILAGVFIPHFWLVVGTLEPDTEPVALALAFGELLVLGAGLLALSAWIVRPLSLRAALGGEGARKPDKARGPIHLVREGGTLTPVRQARPYRGPVWNNPVAWKEVKVRERASCLVRTLMGLALAVGAPLLFYWILKGSVEAVAVNGITLFLEVGIFGLAAASLSASAIAREREEEKLDLLAVTPVTAAMFWLGKWAGVLRGMLVAWVVLAVHMAFWFVVSWSSSLDASARVWKAPFGLAPFMALLVHLASVAAIVSVGLFVSLHARKVSAAAAVTLTIVLAWWIGVPLLLSAFGAERFVADNGAGSPFAAVVQWAEVESPRVSRGMRGWGEAAGATIGALGASGAVALAFTGLFFWRFPRQVRY